MNISSTALITGAAKGIGAATVKSLAQAGINEFILLDRDQAGLAALAEQLPEVHIQPLVVDLADLPQLAQQLGVLLKTVKSIDILINNAGIASENEPDDWHSWKRIMAINLDAPFLITSLCLPYMNEGASIINMASILGRAGKVHNSGYCASKHGLLGYSKALALDLASRQIRVNTILPGWVDTPMLQHELAQQASLIGMPANQILRNARKQIPLRRFVLAEEVASMVTYLASPQAASITAQSFIIDGGFTCGM